MKRWFKVRFEVEAVLDHHGQVLRDAYEDEAVIRAENKSAAWDQVRDCDRNLISVTPIPAPAPAAQPVAA